MTKIVDGDITARFDQPRPISKPVAERTHVHGAIDIAAPIGTPIVAPERGMVFAWIAQRHADGMYWPGLPFVHGDAFPWANYFYDMYGGCLVLRVYEGAEVVRTHIMSHCYGKQLSKLGLAYWVEEKDDARFPIHAIYSDLMEVAEGQQICAVGNAGYSTGPHVHWEIHPGNRWYTWSERINPEEAIK
jgi:hypothetical protein